MRIINCEQRSPEWLRARTGVVTASAFSSCRDLVGGLDDRQALFVKLVKGGMDKKSAAKEAGYANAPTAGIVAQALAGESVERTPGAKYIVYRDDLVTERITGDLRDNYTSFEMKWGIEHEPQAKAAYERHIGEMVEEVGFVMHDDLMIGCSPDGLVRSAGMVEIKCPVSGRDMAEAWLEWDKSFADYEDQVRGQMWLCEREWCDLVVYHPRFPLLVRRIEVDHDKQQELAKAVMDFEKEVAHRTAAMRQQFKENHS